MASEVIVGTELINGNLRLGHTYYEVSVLKELIPYFGIKNFVEIGVHEGGLSYLLIPEFYNTVNYYGMELDCGIVRSEVRAYYDNPIYNATLVCGDCFNENMLSFVGLMPGKKLIYCDGGHKALELKAYAPLCKSGDFIFSHDYSNGSRAGKGLPNQINAEVLPSDIQFLIDDPSFRRMDNDQVGMYVATRITGFWKV